MPYRSRQIIKRDKHEITWSNLAQDASSIQVINLAKGVFPATKDGANPIECEIGSKLSSIYFEFHFSANVVTNPKVIHWQVFRTLAGQTQPSPATYYNEERAQIIKRGMEMLPKALDTVFKRVFVVRIPKFMQRMREDSTWSLGYISTSTEAINACGFAIYQERS